MSQSHNWSSRYFTKSKSSHCNLERKQQGIDFKISRRHKEANTYIISHKKKETNTNVGQVENI
jgi:hypothetical protein